MPQLKLVTRICLGCGKVETGKSRDLTKKYCSRECWRSCGAGQHLKTGTHKNCAHCGNQFYLRGSSIDRGRKFCSDSCYRAATAAIPLIQICARCNVPFAPRRNIVQEFCSYRCSKLGLNNPQWNGKLKFDIQRPPLSRLWRRAVYKRDNYQCQICGENRKKLQCHHLDAYHWCVSRREDVANGVTLCVDCHREFHKQYGTSFNTEQQFLEHRLQQLWTVSGPRASAVKKETVNAA